MRTVVFTVTKDTWPEHALSGVAAINDPFYLDQSKINHAMRQKVMTEISGLRPGDRVFFYLQGEKVIHGGFQVSTSPFFSQQPVLETAKFVNAKFPFRVGFIPTIVFPRPLHINEVWAGRDSGQIWTMQQARGDSVGRHACWSLTHIEGDLLLHMLQEVNLIITPSNGMHSTIVNNNPLPYDLSFVGVKEPHFHYEATLQSILLEDLADGKWTDIFGTYSDFMPFVSTSEGREIDVLLMKNDACGNLFWFLILELKADRFTFSDLLQLLAYETWLTSGRGEGNPRIVHMAAIANRFDPDVIDQIRVRNKLGLKDIHLITYNYSGALNLSTVQLDDQNDL